MSLIEQLAGLPEVSNAPVVAPSDIPKRKKIVHDPAHTVEVIPYNANLDPNADSFLPWLWRKLQSGGLVDLYFPDAAKTGFAMLTRMFSGGVKVLLVVLKDQKGEVVDVVGFATWEPMTFGQAQAGHAGFIFFPDYWDHHTSDAAAYRIMEFWFGNPDNHLDIAIGIIASLNVLAQRFLRRIGWAHVGELPGLHQYKGQQCAASLWYITRDAFAKMEVK